MRRFIPLFVLVGLVVLSAGCRKDNDAPPPGNHVPVYPFLLKSMTWDNGTKVTLSYNSDSSLKQMAYAYEASSEVIDYSWSGGQLVSMAYASSPYKNVFSYDNGKLVKVVNAFKVAGNAYGYTFEYSYDAGGRLSELKYFTVNEEGTRLITTSGYAYAANGDLQSITVAQINNIKVVYLIEGYSAACAFNPWTFVSAALTDNYFLYNYPLLSQLKKLPLKITQVVQQAGLPDRTEKIETNVYTISNRRLDQFVSSFSYYGHPELNQTRSVVYAY